jgi:hypothetical protein
MGFVGKTPRPNNLKTGLKKRGRNPQKQRRVFLRYAGNGQRA